MEALLYSCCGLDIHRDVIEACILRGEEQQPEPIHASFSAERDGLRALLKWTEEQECYSIAMESTGVYWIPVYEAFEENAKYLETLWVVNPRHMRNLPGRKSDVQDAEWIATLLRHGLLEKSFIPSKDIRTLREFARLRRNIIQERASNLNRLERLLQNRGFKFSSVMSNIYGVSGKALLYELRDTGCISEAFVEEKCRRLKRPISEICDAVCGTLSNAEQVLLRELLEIIDFEESKIERLSEAMSQLAEQYNAQVSLLTSIPGISNDSAMEIIAEISEAPQEHFDSAAKFSSWTGVCPRNDESAGSIKCRKILHGNTHLKALLCELAWVSVRSRKSVFHDWYWGRVGKLGKKKAIIAVAHKLTILIYTILKSGRPYSFPV